jgi:hypothetical protein
MFRPALENMRKGSVGIELSMLIGDGVGAYVCHLRGPAGASSHMADTYETMRYCYA